MKFIFNKTFWPKHLHSGTCTIKLSCHHCHSKLQKVTILMSKLFHVFNDIAPTSLMTRKFYSISPPSCWYLNSSERLVIGTYCSRVFPKSHNVGMYYSRKSFLVSYKFVSTFRWYINKRWCNYLPKYMFLQATWSGTWVNIIWVNPSLFLSIFVFTQLEYKLTKRRCCAWDLNPGWQICRRWRIDPLTYGGRLRLFSMIIFS